MCKFLGLEINMLPPYTPQLEPVELVFGMSKKRIQRQDVRQQINYGNPSGKKSVMDLLRNLDVTTCCKIWTKFIKISKSCIIEARESARLENFLKSDPLRMDNIDELEVARQDIEERSENMDSSGQELV